MPSPRLSQENPRRMAVGLVSVIAASFCFGVLFQKVRGIAPGASAAAAASTDSLPDSEFNEHGIYLTDLNAWSYPKSHWPDSARKKPDTKTRRSIEKTRAAVIRRELEVQRSRLDEELRLREDPAVAAGLDALERARAHGLPSDLEMTRNIIFAPGYVRAIRGLDDDYRTRMTESILQFDRALKAMGTDLIVLWMPNKLDTYSFLLSEDVGRTSICPDRTRLIIDLLENDVEVLDLREKLRVAAKETRSVVYHRFDHHWSSEGIEIVARAIRERCERYPFAGEAAGHRQELRSERRWIEEAASRRQLLPDPEMFQSGTVLTRRVLFREEPIRVDKGSPLLLMGDSNVIYLERSSAGLLAHVTRELGLPAFTHGRSASAHSVPLDFREKLADTPPQVLVWVVNGAMPDAEEDDAKWWKPVSFDGIARPTPEKSAALNRDRFAGTRSVKILSAPTIPDPKLTPYKDAVMVHEAEIVGSGDPGSRGAIVHVLTWAYQDRVMNPNRLEIEQVYALELKNFGEAQEDDPLLGSVQIFDETENFDRPRYWGESSGPR